MLRAHGSLRNAGFQNVFWFPVPDGRSYPTSVFSNVLSNVPRGRLASPVGDETPVAEAEFPLKIEVSLFQFGWRILMHEHVQMGKSRSVLLKTGKVFEPRTAMLAQTLEIERQFAPYLMAGFAVAVIRSQRLPNRATA